MTIVITGAGSGIGRAFTRMLHERGDALVLVARSEGRAAELRTEFPGVSTLVADLLHPGRIAQALSQQRLPERVDALVHVAGVVDLGRVDTLTPELWEQQLAVNLVSPAEFTRLLLPAVRTARGQILFVNSGSGLRTHPDWSAYAASKHGLKALADGLRGEEAAHGVRVTSVFPGRTATPMQERVHEQEGKPYDPAQFVTPESVATSMLTALDLPRDAQITDLMIRPGVS